MKNVNLNVETKEKELKALENSGLGLTLEHSDGEVHYIVVKELDLYYSCSQAKYILEIINGEYYYGSSFCGFRCMFNKNEDGTSFFERTKNGRKVVEFTKEETIKLGEWLSKIIAIVESDEEEIEESIEDKEEEEIIEEDAVTFIEVVSSGKYFKLTNSAFKKVTEEYKNVYLDDLCEESINCASWVGESNSFVRPREMMIGLGIIYGSIWESKENKKDSDEALRSILLGKNFIIKE